MMESYSLGGEVIRVLATDPQLPDELVDGGLRERLRRRMREYERVGGGIWRRVLYGGGDAMSADSSATPHEAGMRAWG